MKWGERELPVYEVVCQRYGNLEGRWQTYLAEEAPVAGLVKWARIGANRMEVYFREVPGSPK
jgi:hypothetical protein